MTDVYCLYAQEFVHRLNRKCKIVLSFSINIADKNSTSQALMVPGFYPDITVKTGICFTLQLIAKMV